MFLPFRKRLFVALLLSAGCAWCEDVQITVFTLKDGTKVEVISYASASQEGEGVYSVTTTEGEKKVLWGNEVIRKETVRKAVGELPEYARGKSETQRKAQAEWVARTNAEKNEEEIKRKAALVRGAELSREGDALRAVAAEEQGIRQRCAMQWDNHQAALARIRAVQEAIRRAQVEYQWAVDELRTLDRWRPATPEERARWQYRRLRADRRMASAEDNIRNGERDLAAVTEQANQFAAQLAQGKAELAQAQAKLAEAQGRYDEARARLKDQPAQPSDPSREVIRPVEPTPADDAAANAPGLKSTVVRSIEKGEFVQLADGSLWEIHPEDRADTARWLPEQEVVVVNGSDPKYANRLVNSATQSAVKARRLK